MKVILVSLLDHIAAMSLRILSSFLKKNEHETYMVFFPANVTIRNKQEFAKLIEKLSPDVVGFTVFTDYLDKAVELTQLIKETSKTLVVWGGPHPSILPEACLEYADIVFQEESELPFLEFVNRLQDKKDYSDINNIVMKKDDRIIKNPLACLLENLDNLPFQDYDLENHFVFNKKGYQQITSRLLLKLLQNQIHIIADRGCPFKCTYCYNADKRKKYETKGKYVRFKSIEKIIEEIKYLKDKFKFFEYVVSWDDNFLLRDEKEINKFAELYKKEINLPLSCLVHPNYVTEEKIKFLKESCRLFHVQIGLEAGSDDVNKDVYQRFVTSKQFITSIKILHKYGISVHTDVLFNNPFESVKNVKETINVLLQIPKPFSINGNSIIFFPETEIYRMAAKEGFITPKEGKIEVGKSNVFATVLGFNEGVKDNPFYTCNFGDETKKYYNILILLTARFPAFMIRYFVNHDTMFNRKLIEKIYLMQDVLIDKIPQAGFNFVNKHIFKPTKIVRNIRSGKHRLYECYYRMLQND